MGETFGGDARRLADVVGLLIVRDAGMRPRSLMYVPPLAERGDGVAVVPEDAPADVLNAMLAVAAGLHLGAVREYALYADGDLIGTMRDRHRDANTFARCFLRGREAGRKPDTDRLGRRAG